MNAAVSRLVTGGNDGVVQLDGHDPTLPAPGGVQVAGDVTRHYRSSGASVTA